MNAFSPYFNILISASERINRSIENKIIYAGKAMHNFKTLNTFYHVTEKPYEFVLRKEQGNTDFDLFLDLISASTSY